jgi:hypothetical protein
MMNIKKEVIIVDRDRDHTEGIKCRRWIRYKRKKIKRCSVKMIPEAMTLVNNREAVSK